MLMKIISTGSKDGNCYALRSNDGEILLLDFGCDRKKILKGINYQISKVVGALLTHEHGDHSRSYKWLLENDIPIYTNDETADHFEVISGEKMIGKLEKIPFQVGSFSVIPFYLPHDGTPNFGFLIEHEEMGKLLYCTDFEYLRYRFTAQRIDHFLMECNHMDDMVDSASAKYTHVLKGHSSLSTIKKIIEVNKTPDLRNVILCHLSRDNADPEEMQKKIQEVVGKWCNVAVAKAEMELKLSKYPWDGEYEIQI